MITKDHSIKMVLLFSANVVQYTHRQRNANRAKGLKMFGTVAKKMTSDATHQKKLQNRAAYLKEEISRILNVTLVGNFRKNEDREYWVDRAKKLNSELSSIEDILKPAKFTKKKSK